jgi:hypothetical protein
MTKKNDGYIVLYSRPTSPVAGPLKVLRRSHPVNLNLMIMMPGGGKLERESASHGGK